MVKNDISKLLIIENEQSKLKNLFHSLFNNGFIVETVCSKDEIDILKKVRSFKPDIVFIDVSTPNNLDKIVICEKIKKQYETEDIQIVIFNEFENAKATNNLSDGSVYLNNAIKTKKSIETKQSDNIKDEHELLTLEFKEVQKAKSEWEQSIDCIEDIIILTDLKDNIMRCNKMLVTLTRKRYDELLGKNWKDIFSKYGFTQEDNESEANDILHLNGNRFYFDCRYVKDTKNVTYGKIIFLHNVTKLKSMEEEVAKKNKELQNAYTKLKEAQSQMLQQEKMASIGLLASGIAHEINNPVGFVMSNLKSLQKYIARILEFVNVQSKFFNDLSLIIDTSVKHITNSVKKKQQSLKIDYILGDIENLIKESLDGTYRIKQIVLDLKNFAHVDEAEYKMADINSGLNSTIHIVWNELKYKVTLEKEYGDIEMTKCNLGQLNQVFMNILINAAQAIENNGKIVVKTWQEGGSIYISISDTGHGMSSEVLKKLFDPFFTTKDVGEGTGLGLSITFDIVKKHKGEIQVESAIGKGSTFTIIIPVTKTL